MQLQPREPSDEMAAKLQQVGAEEARCEADDQGRQRRQAWHRGAWHKRRQLFHQPAAGFEDAAMAFAFSGGPGWSGVRWLARPRALCPGDRHRFLSKAGRGPLCAYDRAASQPWPHQRPQRSGARGQRGCAINLGDPQGSRYRPREAAGAGQDPRLESGRA